MSRDSIPSPTTPTGFLARLPRAWRTIALVLMIAIAYASSLRNGFLWDDDHYVTENPTLRDGGGLASIWLEPAAKSHPYDQYYPLVLTTFWIEYQLFGPNPMAFHAVNVLLHILATCLLLALLERLRVPCAWLAAACFGLHPLQVESVAWITELKNVQSGALYFAAALAYARFEADAANSSSHSSRRWYALAFLAYSGALLSKTVTCTLPATWLVITWWRRGRVSKQDVVRLLPFFGIGIVLGLTTAWIERTKVGAFGEEWDHTFLERCLIASRALCFYAGKLIWPADLTFIYPRWQIDAAAPSNWFYPAVVLGIGAACWFARSRIGRGPVAALLAFTFTLGPALGFVNVYPMRYSFVADHFQYLACAPALTLLVAAVTTALRNANAERIVPLLGGGLLLVLAVVTSLRTAAYANQETLWRDTLARNPACWMAHNNLGIQLAQQGKAAAAAECFEAALRLHPQHAKAERNLGHARLELGDLAAAIPHYEAAIRIDPDFTEAYSDLAFALARAGRIPESIERYQTAIELGMNDATTYSRLGDLLLQARRAEEAVTAFQRAASLTHDAPESLFRLGNALMTSGKLVEARIPLERLVLAEPRSPDARFLYGSLLARLGESSAARTEFEQGLEFRPSDLSARQNLGALLESLGDPAGAAGQYEAALRTQPDAAPILNSLAWIRATCERDDLRDGASAVRLAESAVRLTNSQNPLCLATLAAAYAETARFPEAVATANSALTLARAANLATIAAAISQHVERYRSGAAWRQPVSRATK